MDLHCPRCKDGLVIEIHLETYQGTAKVDEDGSLIELDEDDLERTDASFDRYHCGGCDADWFDDEALLLEVRSLA